MDDKEPSKRRGRLFSPREITSKRKKLPECQEVHNLGPFDSEYTFGKRALI